MIKQPLTYEEYVAAFLSQMKTEDLSPLASVTFGMSGGKPTVMSRTGDLGDVVKMIAIARRLEVASSST